MATQDGIIAEVTGKVSRHFDTKKGPAFGMEFERRNSEFPVRVSVFGADTVPPVGSRLTVRGIFSWTTREVEGKRYVNYSVNAFDVREVEPAPAQNWEDEWAREEPF